MSELRTSDTQCATCGLELGHPNAPCPNCLPNFPGTKRMVTSKERSITERQLAEALHYMDVDARMAYTAFELARALFAAADIAGAAPETEGGR